MSEDNVERVDFGKERRDRDRKLDGLLAMAMELHDKVLADPKPYLEAAFQEIFRLKVIIRRCKEALHAPMPEMDVGLGPVEQTAPETMTVDAAEWRRLKRLERIVRDAD